MGDGVTILHPFSCFPHAGCPAPHGAWNRGMGRSWSLTVYLIGNMGYWDIPNGGLGWETRGREGEKKERALMLTYISALALTISISTVCAPLGSRRIGAFRRNDGDEAGR